MLYGIMYGLVYGTVLMKLLYGRLGDAMGNLQVPAALNVKASVFEHYKKKEP